MGGCVRRKAGKEKTYFGKVTSMTDFVGFTFFGEDVDVLLWEVFFHVVQGIGESFGVSTDGQADNQA